MSWLALVPVCEGYAYQNTILCEGCAIRTIEHLQLEGRKNTSNPNDFPQYRNINSNLPEHCNNGYLCVNVVQIPGGKKIGCPIRGNLTKKGIEATQRSIAEHILFGSSHQKAIGRLWLHLIRDSVAVASLLRLNNITSPLPASVKKILFLKGALRSPGNQHIIPEFFTDLESLYGAIAIYSSDMANNVLVLWKITVDDIGKLSNVLTVQLPASELRDRPLEETITEAVSSGAWD